MKQQGKVKFFNEQKGFGFITADDGQEYFFHFTSLPQGTIAKKEEVVSFELKEGKKGQNAVKIEFPEL